MADRSYLSKVRSKIDEVSEQDTAWGRTYKDSMHSAVNFIEEETGDDEFNKLSEDEVFNKIKEKTAELGEPRGLIGTAFEAVRYMGDAPGTALVEFPKRISEGEGVGSAASKTWEAYRGKRPYKSPWYARLAADWVVAPFTTALPISQPIRLARTLRHGLKAKKGLSARAAVNDVIFPYHMGKWAAGKVGKKFARTPRPSAANVVNEAVPPGAKPIPPTDIPGYDKFAAGVRRSIRNRTNPSVKGANVLKGLYESKMAGRRASLGTAANNMLSMKNRNMVKAAAAMLDKKRMAILDERKAKLAVAARVLSRSQYKMIRDADELQKIVDDNVPKIKKGMVKKIKKVVKKPDEPIK